jgi:predicted acyl esterase
MTNVSSSGTEHGQRQLNGPQTTGREYRNLSQPTHAMAQMNLGGGLNRLRQSETDPPGLLYWTTPALHRDLDLTGTIELQLDATPDAAFIVVLQDVDENENAINVTSGYLRASLRKVDQRVQFFGVPLNSSRSDFSDTGGVPWLICVCTCREAGIFSS